MAVNLFYCFLRLPSLSFLHFPALSLVSNDYCSLYHFPSVPVCRYCEICRPGLWLAVNLFYCFLRLPSLSFLHFPALSLVSNDYCSLYHFPSVPVCRYCEICRPGLWLPVNLFYCFLRLPSLSFLHFPALSLVSNDYCSLYHFPSVPVCRYCEICRPGLWLAVNLFYCFLRLPSLSFLHFPALSLVSNDYCSLYHFQSFPISSYVTGPYVLRLPSLSFRHFPALSWCLIIIVVCIISHQSLCDWPLCPVQIL